MYSPFSYLSLLILTYLKKSSYNATLYALTQIGRDIFSSITTLYISFHAHIHMLIEALYVGFYGSNVLLQDIQVLPKARRGGLYIDD